RGGMWRVPQVVRDSQHTLERGLAELLRVVEGEGDRGLGDTGSGRHVSDGDPRHPGATQKGTRSCFRPHLLKEPDSINRFTKSVQAMVGPSWRAVKKQIWSPSAPRSGSVEHSAG